jgi:hypothetical protein
LTLDIRAPTHVLDVVMMIGVGLVWPALAIWPLTFPHTTPLA